MYIFFFVIWFVSFYTVDHALDFLFFILQQVLRVKFDVCKPSSPSPTLSSVHALVFLSFSKSHELKSLMQTLVPFPHLQQWLEWISKNE